jgi:5-methylcytosine-specific restriction endonuclease McrA
MLNAKALVLNQSYEPLTVCTIKRATMLVFSRKAELVSRDERRAIRTVSGDYPWPSVIRLARYVKAPYRNVSLTRKNILRRDRFRCVYCGRGDVPLTIDHVVPKSRGGRDSWKNLAAACHICNNRKGDRLLSETNMTLRVKPYKPTHILFIRNSVNLLDERWKPYLYLV